MTGIAVLAAALAAACDQGAVALVENQTDQDLIVRATGTSYTSDTGDVPDEIVVVAPANTKRVAFQIAFAGGFRAQRLEILRPDRAPVYSEPFIHTSGTYIVVDDNASVSIRRDFPRNGDPAEKTDDCRTLPSASPRS